MLDGTPAGGNRTSALTDFVPLYTEDAGTGLVSQYDKDDVERAGLVKFDFLGLKTLTIIDWAVKSINAQRKSDETRCASETYLLVTSKLLTCCVEQRPRAFFSWKAVA